MNSTPIASKPQTSRWASLAFFLSLSAALLGIFGATPYPKMLTFPMTSPQGVFEISISENKLQIPLGEWIYYALAIYPLIAGFFGIVLGWGALGKICRSEGTKGGEIRSVFATLIGLLAFSIGLVSSFVIWIWPRLEIRI